MLVDHGGFASPLEEVLSPRLDLPLDIEREIQTNLRTLGHSSLNSSSEVFATVHLAALPQNPRFISWLEKHHHLTCQR